MRKISSPVLFPVSVFSGVTDGLWDDEKKLRGADWFVRCTARGDGDATVQICSSVQSQVQRPPRALQADNNHNEILNLYTYTYFPSSDSLK